MIVPRPQSAIAALIDASLKRFFGCLLREGSCIFKVYLIAAIRSDVLHVRISITLEFFRKGKGRLHEGV
jgi:hypothetical protein